MCYTFFVTEDPVGSMFDHEPSPQNAVHKMLIDVFGEQDTANMFYTNDLKVFIEIVARKLLDLSPEDKVRLAVFNKCGTHTASLL